MRAAVTSLAGLVLVGLLGLTNLALGSTGVAPAGDSADRALVTAAQLRELPYRGFVLVSIGEQVVCTGFVIAPTKVVTAGHCLTRNASDGDFRLRRDLPGGVRLYRAYSQAAGGATFGACAVSRAWAHPQFVKRDATDTAYASRAHDYAVLTTAPDCLYPQRAVLRLWPTTASDGQLPSGSPIKLGGYPADSRFSDMTGLNLWRSQGDVRPAPGDARILDTTGFVAQGMSGSPIWRKFGAESPCGRSQCVVGILTECEVNSRGQCKLGDSVRRAVRITPTVRDVLRSR